MIAKTGYLLIAALQLFILSACATAEADIIGKWKLQTVIYDDGSVNDVGEGNLVIFSKNEIVEQIKGHGSRSYLYTRKGSVLVLGSDNSDLKWEIIKAEDSYMEILTPIGTYNLQRMQ
ncbi:hypothetical protein KJY73_10930 [Bowmanella sp. Y26]|uniref:hypothetical protein n=1 Tax=Bowmanella yangjiangensis TaxID=2811230 RepID=UPI001BDBBCE1|nr:hypothetical protein [Bowmanella yangjiangensis]MBT1064091.1 hypothetical protein [Bowmanella yangjiangensis]